jgi:hypothetical protein
MPPDRRWSIIHKAQHHQPAGRVIYEGNQRTTRPASLEPGMIESVDLHELANAFPEIAGLMN